MKRRIVCIFVLTVLILSVCGCEKKNEAKENVAATNEIKEDGIETAPEEELGEIEEAVDKEIDEKEEIAGTKAEGFDQFEGTYAFRSGVGAWATEVTLSKDGSFTGEYHDTDMGDMNEEYPNGTVYSCVFEGKFKDLEPVDDYVFTAKLDYIKTEEKDVSEEIIDGTRYIYSDPYGFDDADEFEFYLPGKPMSELSEAFLSWMSCRMLPIPPAVLISPAFYNVGGQQGFEMTSIPEKIEVPQSLDVELYQLSGEYIGENGLTLYVSMYTDVPEDDEVGCYSWEEDADSYAYRPEGKVLSRDGKLYFKVEYWDEYTIVITNNEDGKVEFSVYDEYGEYFGAFKMTEHFES